MNMTALRYIKGQELVDIMFAHGMYRILTMEFVTSARGRMEMMYHYDVHKDFVQVSVLVSRPKKGLDNYTAVRATVALKQYIM